MTAAVAGVGVPPRFATARDPRRATFGPQAAAVARGVFGFAALPWQQQVLDTALELDDAGLFVHPLVVVTVQRQSGKTTLDLGNSVHRALFRPRQRVWHTAQTGQDARDKFGELADLVTSSPLAGITTHRRTNGSEVLAFANGSTLRPHPPTPAALHGKQGDLNNIDEPWVFDDVSGAALLQAIVPTQATRPGAQTWLFSTAGTARSTFLRSFVDRGRAGDPGVAYFEWSIPDDVDPTNLDDVARFHPAYGLTIGRRALEAARDVLSPGEFARAYGNRWTTAGERVIDETRWTAGTVEHVPADLAATRPALGAAVSVDRGDAAVAAAWWDQAADVIWCELIDYRPGTAWAAPRFVELSHRHPTVGAAIDRVGPSGALAADVELAGVDLLAWTTRDVTAAAGNVWDRYNADAADGLPRIRHVTHPGLDSASNAAVRRTVGDGAWTWGRSASVGSIAPLEAMTAAVHAVQRQPLVPDRPRIVVPRR